MDTILWLLTALIGSIILFLYVKKDRRFDKNIPHLPYAFPIIGNLPMVVKSLFFTEDNLDQTTYWMEKLDHYYLSLPGLGMQLEISDPESIQYILSDNFDNYPTTDVRKAMGKDIWGDGIFMADGPSWKLQRKLATPVFKVSSLKKMIPIFARHTSKLVEILEKQRKLDSHRSLDIQELFKRLTLDTIGEIGFGVNIGSLDQPVEFSRLFDWVQDEITRNFFFPFLKLLHYTEWKNNMRKMDQFVFDIIQVRKNAKKISNNSHSKVGGEEREQESDEDKENAQNDSKFNDLLSIYLSTTDKNTGEAFSDTFLRDQLMNFFIAGRDTTALLLTWTFYLLSQHPRVEEKVLQEMREIIPSSENFPQSLSAPEDPAAIEADYQTLRQLKYLRMVLDETLRLYPPAVPHNSKQAVKDDQLPNGCKVHAGQLVGYCNYAVHRLKRYWGPDAEEFRPERWEDPHVLKHPYQFIPFQKGPRVCLGMDMAYEEVKLVMVMMMMNGNLRLRLDPTQRVTYLDTATVPAKYGMRMFIKSPEEVAASDA
jgi:cytochrome P450